MAPATSWNVPAQGPRSLELTGRVADGWAAPIPSYLPYERWRPANDLLDRTAEEHGRVPGAILRMAQLPGLIETGLGATAGLREGADPLRANADVWVAELTRLGTEQPFDAFVFWPEEETPDQVRRFAEDIAPRVKANLARG
jgi:hypothetical protein